MFRFFPFFTFASPIAPSFATPVPNQGEKLADASFDYVVVGGGQQHEFQYPPTLLTHTGTAGLAVAARISENLAISVAVIEAGGYYETHNPLLSSTPAGDVIWVGTSHGTRIHSSTGIS
jgi:choline dehydrogenase